MNISPFSDPNDAIVMIEATERHLALVKELLEYDHECLTEEHKQVFIGNLSGEVLDNYLLIFGYKTKRPKPEANLHSHLKTSLDQVEGEALKQE